MTERTECPKCHSKAFKSTSRSRNGRKRRECLECGARYVIRPKRKMAFSRKEERERMASNLANIPGPSKWELENIGPR